MEADSHPKRVSVWDARTGELRAEFFGPTGYGALGGAIDPLDPDIVAGMGCEWRIDPATGRARCTGTILRDGMEVSRFGIGANGRLYLAVASTWAFDAGPLRIFERIGEGEYKLRTAIDVEKDPKTNQVKATVCWADANGDGERQDGEIARVAGHLRFSGWYMGMTADLTLWGSGVKLPVAGFTACDAPKYDLDHPVKLPPPPGDTTGVLGSPDGRLVLYGGPYGIDAGWFTCYEVATGKLRWTYPDSFNGVHGSHRAPPPAPGFIRGSYGPCGSAKLPAPIGCVWVIPTNVGEWHILTEDGYYLTPLFQADPLAVRWPERALPGAVLDDVPPGSGGEDFGGSIALSSDGELFLQAGKTAFWNVEVTGLDTVKALGEGRIEITEGDARRAREVRERILQQAAGARRIIAKRMTPAFSGSLDNDFRGAEIIRYAKNERAAIRSAVAWDDRMLYAGWDVRDETPWKNGADAPEFLYARGDTVDLQLGSDPRADPNRDDGGLGDLRLSIGNFRRKPAAVIYRKAASEKRPMTFRSGVVREYVMESVRVLDDVRIEVKVRSDGYTIEVAIPLAALGFAARAGLVIRGDFGATHGDAAGGDTALRTFWSNQHTGIVDDEVFELRMEPRYWGEIAFEE